MVFSHSASHRGKLLVISQNDLKVGRALYCAKNKKVPFLKLATECFLNIGTNNQYSILLYILQQDPKNCIFNAISTVL